MTNVFTLGRSGRLVLALSTVLSVSCASDLTRTGRSPAYLVIDSLGGQSGADKSAKAGNPLNSDVVTFVELSVNGQKTRVATIFNDLGSVKLHMALKNPETPTGPSSLNLITLTRYHVSFRRADGRGQQGVDVPYAFDGGVTQTIGTDGTDVGFELVRIQMKEEPPLKNLAGGGGANFISTLADVTFYGRDQAGNEVSVTGTISVNFGDFADPE